MRISDWSSDVCSSDLLHEPVPVQHLPSSLPRTGRHACALLRAIEQVGQGRTEIIRPDLVLGEDAQIVMQIEAGGVLAAGIADYERATGANRLLPHDRLASRTDRDIGDRKSKRANSSQL